MSNTVTGVVTNGVVVPSSPLPEGARVEIRLTEAAPSSPRQPRTSLADWADQNAEDWGSRLSSEDVEGFTGRRF